MACLKAHELVITNLVSLSQGPYLNICFRPLAKTTRRAGTERAVMGCGGEREEGIHPACDVVRSFK
jgi:hypothetical protein